MQAVTEGVATEGSRNFSGEGPASCGGRQWSRGRCRVQMGLRWAACACEFLDLWADQGSPHGGGDSPSRTRIFPHPFSVDTAGHFSPGVLLWWGGAPGGLVILTKLTSIRGHFSPPVPVASAFRALVILADRQRRLDPDCFTLWSDFISLNFEICESETF